MKILILGCKGMLGSECKQVFSQDNQVIAPDKNELDIISWDGVIESLQRVRPDVVINCAGFTDVDACETETFAVRKINIEGPRNLAQCCARFDCKLIHISSDYLFDGQKPMPQPYFEDDVATPLSAYGKSKMDSEVAVRGNSPDYIIVRSGWLYGLNGRNFVKSIVNQAIQKKSIMVANDQFGSPTWAYRLAVQIREILNNKGRGTYHATAEGYCSKFECARYILEKLNIRCSVRSCTMKDAGRLAKRPANCLLENRRLKNQGINAMIDWKDDMDNFLQEFGDKLVKQAITQQA